MNCRHIFTWGHIHKCSSCRPVVGLLACLVLTIVYVIFILMTYQYTVDDEVLGPSAWSKDTTQGSEITPQFKYTERVSQQENVKNQDVSVNPSRNNQGPSYERPEGTIVLHKELELHKEHKVVLQNYTDTVKYASGLITDIKVNVSVGKNTDIGSGSYTAIWVEAHVPFLQRLSWYNAAISEVRRNVWDKRKKMKWKDISEDITTVWCNRDDFHQELERYSVVKTIALEWDRSSTLEGGQWGALSETRNLLINKYYTWTGSERLCSLVRAVGGTRAHYDAVFNRSCTTDIYKNSLVVPLEPLYLHGKPVNKEHYWPNQGRNYPPYFYTTPPPQVFYLHVLEDVVVTSLGDVLTGNLKLVPYSCSQDLRPGPPPGYHESPLHEEVFIMGQYWGGSFFHKMLENLPRVVPYIDFLNAHPSIKIHAAETTGYTYDTLSFLGLDPHRLIKGTIRAKVTYMPQATPCGFAQIQSVQLLAHMYQEKLRGKYGEEKRQSIVLVRRSGSRKFTQHMQIQRHLEDVAKEFHLKFELFIDNPSPSMEEAMRIFRRAMVVVAPHGAGLSNIIYSQPGTIVLEGVCNPPHVNLCFQWAAHILGHRYHGLLSRRGCESVVDVDHEEVKSVVRTFLLKTF